CAGGSKGIAIADGMLYIANEGAIHRFTIGDDCKLAAAGEPLAMPANNPRPQVVDDGPVYMRSGGVAWELVQTQDAIYAHDFLVGTFRIDRGKVEPVCTSEFGFRSLAKVGKRLFAQRQGIEELVLGAGGACKTRSARIDDKARGMLFSIRGQLYGGFDSLVRYDGASAMPLAKGVRLCAIAAMTACGEGACVLDHNCPKLLQLAPDGTALREIATRDLFDTRPSMIAGLATAPDGRVFVYARHRDQIEGRERCEAAVYVIPAATFAQ
ncbi:MAG TPA: hypothetical protein VK427_23755, partial [Kofleriaceae bacterium]|nr:hypothetical protein [Kofleriaceae bacterium]